MQFLFLDALIRVFGVLSRFTICFAVEFLAWYLGFFAGFLLYLGAGGRLPKVHSQRSSYSLVFLTVLGMTYIYVLARPT